MQHISSLAFFTHFLRNSSESVRTLVTLHQNCAFPIHLPPKFFSNAEKLRKCWVIETNNT